MANDHNTDRLTHAEEHLANGRLVTLQQYGLDAASRLTNKFTAPKMHPASFAPFSGTYDDDNRFTPSSGFTHDTDGNMLAMPGVPEGNAAIAPGALGATWDTRNRLSALTGAAGYRAAFSATYAYDAEGNRTDKTVNAQTTTWMVNPHGFGGLSQVLVETVGTTKKFFVYGPTGLLYDVDTAATPNVRHYHTDQVGSTVALTNQVANQPAAVIGRAEYSVYGMVSYREGDTATPFLYNGAYGVMTDAESGLLNMRARYYHPWIGRFASPDPVGFSGGMNWFAYADGDPILGNDPNGLATTRILYQGGGDYRQIIMIDPSVAKIRAVIAGLPDKSIKAIEFLGHGESNGMTPERGDSGKRIQVSAGGAIVNGVSNSGRVIWTDTDQRVAETLVPKLQDAALIGLGGCHTADTRDWFFGFGDKNNVSQRLSSEIPTATVVGFRGMAFSNELSSLLNRDNIYTRLGLNENYAIGLTRAYKNGVEFETSAVYRNYLPANVPTKYK